MLKKILIGLVLVVGGLLGYAATRPGTYHVERWQEIMAPAWVVYAQIEDFRNWGAWSPWEKLDPDMKKTFEGPKKGVGASYSWEGNADVGKGKMTITDAKGPSELTCRLEFIEPFAAVAETGFTLSPRGEDAVMVTWSIDGTKNFMSKVFGVFMDMDEMIGADYEKGLAALKVVSEGAAEKEAGLAKAEAEAAGAAAAEAAVAAQRAVIEDSKRSPRARKAK